VLLILRDVHISIQTLLASHFTITVLSSIKVIPTELNKIYDADTITKEVFVKGE